MVVEIIITKTRTGGECIVYRDSKFKKKRNVESGIDIFCIGSRIYGSLLERWRGCDRI